MWRISTPFPVWKHELYGHAVVVHRALARLLRQLLHRLVKDVQLSPHAVLRECAPGALRTCRWTESHIKGLRSRSSALSDVVGLKPKRCRQRDTGGVGFTDGKGRGIFNPQPDIVHNLILPKRQKGRRKEDDCGSPWRCQKVCACPGRLFPIWSAVVSWGSSIIPGRPWCRGVWTPSPLPGLHADLISLRSASRVDPYKPSP